MSMHAACVSINCGTGGDCVRDSGLSYQCQCQPGFKNLSTTPPCPASAATARLRPSAPSWDSQTLQVHQLRPRSKVIFCTRVKCRYNFCFILMVNSCMPYAFTCSPASQVPQSCERDICY
ncbi:hypothetical protein BAE44_0023840 [Dichanthelium oligosanthes]|uniref:EGF-like domain-containing protein n=1 Tax=Dichanthelium oligosanthes TaxID=888268 RepID=A0A1E5UQL0_9POAL|nr:hypothetical protein BAE44_0023840 [Dichanthelium oligosanthes]